MTNDKLLDWTRLVLATTPERWLSLCQSLPAGLLAGPPLPGEWSALECLQHLVDTERWVFPIRVRYLLAEQDFPAFDPDSQGTRPTPGQSPALLAETFGQLRTESLALLLEVTAADLEKRARHQELGIVSLGEMMHEWAAHDLMHTVQAEQALMQPFIRGSGPWRSYFAAHEAAPA